MTTLNPDTNERKNTKHSSMEKTSKKIGIRSFFRKKTDQDISSKDEPAKQHTSPAHSAQEKSSSLGAAFKGGRRVKGRGSGKGMWRPKKRKGDWESYSGRQLTLQNVSVNDLSPLEIEFLQRQAVTSLQAMDIGVSHGILKSLSARGMFQRTSLNSQARRKITDKELHGVFGQPLEAIVGVTPRTPAGSSFLHSTTSFPVLPNLEKQSNSPLPSSPTRTPDTPNELSTSTFDPSTVVSPPSPRTLRRQALTPLEQQVPTIVRKAIEHLDTKGVKVEGLFRIPGSKARIAELREKIDAGSDIELTEDTNPHDVACLLKEFFRCLPEPLLTRELYYPFLSTTKHQNPGHRRDALRLLCVLLPQPNRDTLQELLQFLSRVALHSYGMILIDGTEESGNRMTEQNLATMLGPNILHKESKRKSLPKSGGEQYQVCKQDPEELSNATKVMEDLIRMHQAIFTIPAQLLDRVLREILLVDHDAVDHLLKKKCIDLGLVLPPREDSEAEPVKVTMTLNDAPLHVATVPHNGSAHLQSQTVSNSLDEALENLTQFIEELSPSKTTYNSNNRSVADKPDVAPPPSTTTTTDGPNSDVTEDAKKVSHSTLSLSKQLYASADSAFSNNSSSHSSTEAVSDTVSDAVSCLEMNALSRNPMSDVNKGLLDKTEYTRTPPNGCGKLVTTHSMPILALDLPSDVASYQLSGGSGDRGRVKKLITPNSKWRHHNMDSSLYEIQRSPILSGKDDRQFYDALCGLSSDHTPTDSTLKMAASTPIAEDGTVL